MTSGVRFNKLLSETFLNGYGGAAGCLLGFEYGKKKKNVWTVIWVGE